jgi:hypothetical protein
VTFIIVLLGSGTGYPFSSFLTKSSIELFFEECSFHPFFFSPLLHLVLGSYVLDRLIGGLMACFLSLDLIFVLLIRLMCPFCSSSGGVN